MKKCISLAAALMLCLALVPAFAETPSLAGTWYISRAIAEGVDVRVVKKEAMTLVINEDGTCSLSADSFGGAQSAAWTFDGTALTVTADGQSVPFRLEGDELVYQAGASTVYLSRTPADPMPLPEVVKAESADAFAGTWRPYAQLFSGLYMPLGEAAASASPMLIENSQIKILLENEEGALYAGATYDAVLEDGMLKSEDRSFFPLTMTLSLRDDGTLFYETVMELGPGMNMTTVAIYVREGAETQEPAA